MARDRRQQAKCLTANGVSACCLLAARRFAFAITNDPPNPNMRTFLRSVLPLLILASSLLAQPASAQSADATAQPQWPQPEPVWTAIFEQQVNQLLDTPDAERQNGAMQLIVQYAPVTNADGEEVFDFKFAVPDLLKVYETEPNPSRRILALSALNAIGDEAAMRTLAALVQHEPSERIRRQTLYVLSAHQQAK